MSHFVSRRLTIGFPIFTLPGLRFNSSIKSGLSIGFCAALLLAVGANEYLFRNFRNTLLWKRHEVLARRATLSTLLMGSSHGYHGFSARQLGEGSFNLAYVSQDLSLDIQIVDQLLDHLPALQNVVFAVSDFSPYSDLEQSPEYWRIYSYFQTYGILPKQFEHLLDVRMISAFYLRSKQEVGLGQVARLVHRPSDLLPGSLLSAGVLLDGVQPDGQMPLRSELRSAGFLSQSAHQALQRHQETISKGRQAKQDEQVLEHLKVLLGRLTQAHVRVTFVIPPMSHAYLAAANPVDQIRFHQWVDGICTGREDCQLLDWERIFDQNDDYFDDADHLNRRGATEFSSRLARAIHPRF